MAWATLILVSSAIALVGTRLASPVVLAAWTWWGRRSASTPRSPRSRWIPAVLLFPVALGLLLAAGAVGAVSLEGGASWTCHCGPSPGFHLCLRHPELAAPLAPYAIAVWLLLGARPVRAAVYFLAAFRRERHLLSRLRALSVDAMESDVHLAPLGRPDALTVGLLRPVIVADRAWWGALTPPERAVAAAHERAHVARRDVLTHLVVRGLAAWQPARLAAPMVADWLDHAEQSADAHAAAMAGDPLYVAELLVRQRRLGMATAGVGMNGGRFDRRIAALLAAEPHTAQLTSDLDATIASGVAVLALAWPLSPALHGAVEALLHHLH